MRAELGEHGNRRWTGGRVAFAVLVACAALVAIAGPAAAQAREEARLTATVRARVAAAPLVGASITVGDTGRGAVTDTAGRAVIRDIPPGVHLVRFEMIGYAPEVAAIEFGPGADVHAEVDLLVRPVQLEGFEVRVEGRRRQLQAVDYYTRKELGHGTFLDGERLEEKKRTASRLSDMLRGIPGIRVALEPSGRYVLESSRGDTSFARECNPALYLDGVRMSAPDQRIEIDRLVPPRFVSAIEVYAGPSEAPIEYRGACGVVLIWSGG